MKVINAFAQIFAIFAFLTLGSLLVIVALHVLPVDEAVFKVRELYSNPFKSAHTGLVGTIFILVGLIFSKMLVKKGRESDAIIYQSEMGPMIVSVSAIEDVVKKVLKRFNMVKEWKIKSLIHGKSLELRLRLVLWSGNSVQTILAEIQQEVGNRIKKILGPENEIEILCDVTKIVEHESDAPQPTHNEKK